MKQFLGVVAGVIAMLVIAGGLAECSGPPVDLHCGDRINSLYERRGHERYPGEMEDIGRDCDE